MDVKLYVWLYMQKMCLQAYANTKGPNQPVRQHSLIWTFAVHY